MQKVSLSHLATRFWLTSNNELLSLMADKETGHPTLKSIYSAYIQSTTGAPTARRFYEMCACGSKYARLAAGGMCVLGKYSVQMYQNMGIGSIYILILVAIQHQRWAWGKVDGNLPLEVGNMLRWPDGR